MSTLNAIKGIRDDLSRDIASAQKSQQQMADQLRTLAANLKAAEATVAAKVRFLASLDAIQREADQALAGNAPVRKQGRKPGPSRKNRAKVASKAAAPTIKPDEVKVRRKSGPKSKAEKAAARAAAKADKAAARLKKKAERDSAKAAGVKLTKDGRPAKKPGPKPGTPRVTKAAGAKAAGAKVTKVKAGRGRRDSSRPPIRDAIFHVLNGHQFTADDIFKELKVKGWLPNSNDPRGYIAYLLSSTKDRFERVKGAGRGVYRCKAGVTVAAAVPATPVEAPKAAPVVVVETPKAEVVETPKAEVVATDGTLRMSADEILSNAGVLGEAAFGG